MDHQAKQNWAVEGYNSIELCDISSYSVLYIIDTNEVEVSFQNQLAMGGVSTNSSYVP